MVAFGVVCNFNGHFKTVSAFSLSTPRLLCLRLKSFCGNSGYRYVRDNTDSGIEQAKYFPPPALIGYPSFTQMA